MALSFAGCKLPATLNCQPMTDVEFMALCSEHPDLSFEMTADCQLIIMAPKHSDSGASSLALAGQFYTWARKDGTGIGCDSSTGFVLPNGARRSPDIFWTLKERINQLKTGRRKAFWHLCPDFVIELRSGTDRLQALQDKMLEYIINGAQLGWLIDPFERAVTIYRPNSEPEIPTNIVSIAGDGPIFNFTLELESNWNPLGD